MIAALALAATLAAGPAPGSVGVSVGAGLLCTTTDTQPGHSYPLGTFYLRNIGSAGETFTASVGNATVKKLGRQVPAAWISVKFPPLLWFIPRHSITLAPGASAYLPVTLAVPAGAASGRYGGALFLQTAAASGHAANGTAGGTVSAGAGGAETIQFTIGKGRLPACIPAYPSVTKARAVPAARGSGTAKPAASGTQAASAPPAAAPGTETQATSSERSKGALAAAAVVLIGGLIISLRRGRRKRERRERRQTRGMW